MHTGKNPQPVFELFDQNLAGAAPDVFGLWATAPLSSSETIAFDASADATSRVPHGVPVWRVNLPADLNLAAAHLAGGEVRLETSRKAIQKAPHRLDAFVRSQSAGLSFDVSLEGRDIKR